MSAQPSSIESPVVEALFDRLISAWNRRNAQEFAACFLSNGNAIGFDGTQMNGARQIKESLEGVFEQHPTAQYVTVVRDVKTLGHDAVLLRAVAGMVPPGANRIKPDVNAVQSLVALRDGADFKIALFQNTPAQFHGRPEAAELLTKELQMTFDEGQRNS